MGVTGFEGVEDGTLCDGWLDGEAPSPESLVYASAGGFISRNGLLVSIRGFSPYRADIAGPRMIDWLCQRKCVDVRYTLEPGFALDEFED